MREKNLRFLCGGGLTGAVNGLFGGGGGMVAVPLLIKSGLPAKRAHATAIAVILPACAVSGFIYLLFRAVSLQLLLPVALGVSLGGALGARLLSSLSGGTVTLLFAVLMLAAGLRLLL